MKRFMSLTRADRSSVPKLGVLDSHPIQYHSPAYRRLAARGKVIIDILYLTDHGLNSAVNLQFGVPVSWDVDLLTGFESSFLRVDGKPRRYRRIVWSLIRWIKSHDAVVVHGYANSWMLLATLVCRFYRIPYLLRGDALPRGTTAGMRRLLRDAVARAVVSGSAGGLAVGQLNAEFYRRFGARKVFFAPFSVDERFAGPPVESKQKLLARWGITELSRPVILLCGKLYPGKRPLDLVAALQHMHGDVVVLFVGDGVMAESIRRELTPGSGVVTGFVNQLELPSYYHAADVLVLPSEFENWGLVVNEAMAAGVVPVVSDRVGAGPDLVDGIGEIYPCGDVAALAAAIRLALERSTIPRARDRVRERARSFSVDRTAAGFERATLDVTALRYRTGRGVSLDSASHRATRDLA